MAAAGIGRVRHGWRALALAVLGMAWLVGASAEAVVIPLTVEFDDGLEGSYGTVEVTQNGDDLDFHIVLGPDLNALGRGHPDLHRFYFNVTGDASSLTGLAIVDDDAPTRSYTLLKRRRRGVAVAGGAGARFDLGVSFGNGGGRRGNGKLAEAFFTLSADQALALGDLSETSNPRSIDPAGRPLNFALHVQDTALVRRKRSETVGGGGPRGVIPEPATFGLLGLGLGALTLLGNRRRP